MKIRYLFLLSITCFLALPVLAQSNWQRKYDAEQLGLAPVWSKAIGAMHEIAPDTVFWYASYRANTADGKIAPTSPYTGNSMQELVAMGWLLHYCAVENEGVKRRYLAQVEIDCPAGIKDSLLPSELQKTAVSSCTRWLRSASLDQTIPAAKKPIRLLKSSIKTKMLLLDVKKSGELGTRVDSDDIEKICSMDMNGKPLKTFN
jgi:hypothetical protein